MKSSNSAMPSPADLLIGIISRNAREEVVDHWHRFIEDFQISPAEFYQAVHEELLRRQIPDLSIQDVEMAEGGIGSARRVYLRLTRDWGRFDICAAPFGTGFFFSYRYIVPTVLGFWLRVGLAVLAGLGVGIVTPFVMGAVTAFLTALYSGAGVLAVSLTIVACIAAPIAGFACAFVWLRRGAVHTFYQQDSALMYLETVRSVIPAVVDRLTLQHGVHLTARVAPPLPTSQPAQEATVPPALDTPPPAQLP